MINFSERLLSDCTTIRLGGTAKHFAECGTEEEIIETLKYGRENNLGVFVLGGGSNVIFPDEGYEGIVLKINLKGISFDYDTVTVRAGEDWDSFVKSTVDNGYTGLECLSGIPGTAGATPIQNVGAYGVEVGNHLIDVAAIDRDSLEKIVITAADCAFSYRNSRFKSFDKDKFIITEVRFKLAKNGGPVIKYPELANYIGTFLDLNSLKGIDKILAVRDAVIKIRRRKSMIYDENDTDSHSCGSFFTNPVINKHNFDEFMSICTKKDLKPPYFSEKNNFKVSAAWLIENSGFNKGFNMNGAGISGKHTLAIVNRGGTTNDVIALSNHIKSTVLENFGILLEMEPILAAYR
ncbi:MAG: UDP-N-acetylmuramate dehydrogenase [Bacteroidetes bacterium]|nr:UDP-N-acetylmuramate dehydrogenase [Bacteroidota bacterium]